MTALTAPPVVPPLSTLLRTGSRQEHEQAESSDFMTELLAGRMSPQGYTHYLAMMREVYVALETVGDELASTPAGRAVVDERLKRLPALDADLAYWARGEKVAIDSPAVAAYVAAIEATRDDSDLYVAHHYTRYLGDLSGGQAIGRILSRAFDLTDGQGVAFYDFSAVGKPKPYKDGYRERLDAMGLSPEAAERVIAEVKRAFDFNSAIFAELTRLYVRG